MQEQKKNRIAAAVTVNVILLAVILVAVLIYQMAVLSVQAAKRKEILEEIKKCEQQLEDSEDALEYLKSTDYLFEIALKYGWHFPDADE